MSFKKVLVANRGEIACRVLQTLREMQIPSVAIHSEVDADTPHTWIADEAVLLDDIRGYLDGEKILKIAKERGVDAIHPGYGFLSENGPFVTACAQAGITFIGPSEEAMRSFGDKGIARGVALKAEVPCVPGAQSCETPEEATRLAAELGFPVLLKAAGGGGGKGMRRVEKKEEIHDAFLAASREAEAAFKNPHLLIEKFIYPARHIEIQVLGDGKNAIAVGERECSLQRRYQKVLEEAPASSIAPKTRQRLREDAIRLVCAVGYKGAGTVEFLVGPDEQHYFLEINTRLQVEHPITEELTGMDLVRQQILIAAGGSLPETPEQRGYAFEARLNAEDPYTQFMPQTGDISVLQWPQMPRVRIDSGVVEGNEISPHYDSMIAKVVAFGETRDEARQRLAEALRQTIILGLKTNRDFLIDLLERDFFIEQKTYTTTVEEETWTAPKLPEHLRELADNLQRPTQKRSSGQGDPDPYNPWTRLTNFRMMP